MRKWVLLLLAVLSLAPPPAAGQARGRAPAPGAAAQPDDVQPLASILQRLRGRVDGRLLDANLAAGPGGRTVYVLRTLERDGRERILTIDARSGEILSERGGR